MSKKDEKPQDECEGLTPVEEAQANAAPDSGGGDNGGGPPKPGGK